MKSRLQAPIWVAIALLGALALATIALHRGEQINALWLVTAAVCTYAVGYRFYSKFIATKVLVLDGQRATPAERLENGRDFLPTNKWVVFGHHFAAICAGARCDLGRTVGIANSSGRQILYADGAWAGDCDHYLRLRGLRVAGLAAACATRLSEHFCEARDHWAAGIGNCGNASHA